MPPARSTEAARPIRLAVLDDNPFVRDADGRVHPVAALFHRFVETVLAVGPFEPAAYLAPVRELAEGEPAPVLRAVDPKRLRIVPTDPFEGIAGYLRRAPLHAARNWPLIRRAVADADLTWIKAPASNAPLVALACRLAHVPRFTWVAGSVREVVGGQQRSGARAIGAAAAGVLYDGTTRLLERSGPFIRLDGDVFTSVVTRDEIEATRVRAHGLRVADDDGSPIRLAWAGRIAEEKGLGDLLAALARLQAAGQPVTLDVVGDGPARDALAALAAQLGLEERVRWLGYVGDRATYLDALRAADLFVLPSHAEGMPKVVVEAMAAGLPIVATQVGAVPAVLDHGARGHLVPVGAPGALADAIAALAADPLERATLRQRGLDFAATHTAEAQAERLVLWMRRTFPALPWPTVGRTT